MQGACVAFAVTLLSPFNVSRWLTGLVGHMHVFGRWDPERPHRSTGRYINIGAQSDFGGVLLFNPEVLRALFIVQLRFCELEL